MSRDTNPLWLIGLAALLIGLYMLIVFQVWDMDSLACALAVIVSVSGTWVAWAIISHHISQVADLPLTRARLRSGLIWLGAALLLASFLPVYGLGRSHPVVSPGLPWYVLGMVLVGVAVLHLVCFHPAWPIWNRWITGHDTHLWVVLAGSYLLTMIGINAYRWRILTLGNVDSAIVVQSLYNTLQGRGLLYNTLEKTSHLGVHNSPIYLLLVPLYALLADPALFLAFIPPLAIAISAWPLYAISRRHLGILAALCLTGAYLFYPSIAARSTGDLYEMTLFPCLLLPALYFYERRNLGRFVLFMTLALAVKESIAATTFMFALYGLWEKREAIWVAIPGLVSVLWIVLSYAIVLPAFGGEAVSSRTAAVLGPLGSGPLDVIRFLLTRPIQFARLVFTLPKLALIYQLLQPLAFIPPLLAAPVLLALPALALNLIAQGGSIGIRAWESVPFGPILFAAAAWGISALVRFVQKQGHPSLEPKRLEALLAISVFFATLSCAPYWFRIGDYMPKPYWQAQRMALNMIPPTASVSAPDYMMAHLAERDYLQLQTGSPFWADYHIVDMHWITRVSGHRLPKETATAYETLVVATENGKSHAQLRRLWDQDGIYVFEHVER